MCGKVKNIKNKDIRKIYSLAFLKLTFSCLLFIMRYDSDLNLDIVRVIVLSGDFLCIQALLTFPAPVECLFGHFIKDLSAVKNDAVGAFIDKRIVITPGDAF